VGLRPAAGRSLRLGDPQADVHDGPLAASVLTRLGRLQYDYGWYQAGRIAGTTVPPPTAPPTSEPPTTEPLSTAMGIDDTAVERLTSAGWATVDGALAWLTTR